MKTVLITGANKGIGYATAKIFAQNGYHVILSGRNEERIKTAAEKLDGDVKYILWDVSKVSTASEILKKAHQLFGNIDIFVNNAGMVSEEDIFGKSFFEKTEAAWDQTMDTNLKGLFFCMQAEAAYMIEHKIEGHIVNVCSEMSFRPAYNAYTASKWGALGLTKGLAKKLSEYGIIVNGIAPGETATDIFRVPEGTPHSVSSPRGERAMPSEIAEGIFFLSNSKNMIGSILLSDGGRSLH